MAAWCSIVICFGSAISAHAQFAGLPAPFLSNKAEFWSGAEATRHAWSSYAGVTWSPLGKLAEDGVRLRVGGGYAQYGYPIQVGRQSISIYGTAAFADLLMGYQMGVGALTLKAFAGASFDGHVLEPFDEGNKVNGSATGAKAALEGWLNITSTTWAQLDASYSTAHSVYSSRVRLGYRVTHGISAGLEGGAFGNEVSKGGRGGGFVRYEWLGGEVSLSGGVSGDIAAPRNPYGTVVYLTRF